MKIKRGLNNMYIRIGKIPIDEESGIYRDGIQIGKEEGVSVYNAILINNVWNIILPSPIRKHKLDTLYSLKHSLSQGCRAYLVRGDLVGKGTDDEPLIKNVEIIEDITVHMWEGEYK